MVEVTSFKTKKDWVRFVIRIADELYPETKKITLVMDNFKTHTASAFYETFEPKGYGTGLNLFLRPSMGAG